MAAMVAMDAVMNDFAEFNANGSGWVLDRVAFTSIHMYNYKPI